MIHRPLLRLIIHSIVLILIFAVVSYLRFTSGRRQRFFLGTGVYFDELVIFACLGIGGFISLGMMYGFYQLSPYTYDHDAHIFSKVWTLRSISLTCLAFFGQGWLWNGISRFILLVVIFLTLIILPSIDRLYLLFIRKRNPQSLSFAVLTGDNISLDDVRPLLPSHTQFVTHYDDIPPTCQSLIFLGDLPPATIEQRLNRGRGTMMSFYHIPSTVFLSDCRVIPSYFLGLPVQKYQLTKIEGWSLIMKRIIDIVGALLGLLLLSPLLLIVAIIIKCTSPGPILYRQTRIGLGGKPFQFVKFRSMYYDDCVGDAYGGSAAWQKRQSLINSAKNVRPGILQKIADDPRVTPIGKWIRKLSIDELPSLRCVLRGDMSLIGPRPHMPHEVARYEEWQKKLFTVKPGITGYAQIHGRDTQDFAIEARYDIWYITNRSLWLDIVILMKTMGVLIGK
ncbi:MAG: sugar transferase [Candidatus Absconditabacterales bacterium]|nr:sugar transferase [Candidatus Absconditabacterales bacterium]